MWFVKSYFNHLYFNHLLKAGTWLLGCSLSSLSPFFRLFILLQWHWPTCCFLNIPGIFLLRTLYCCFLFLECFALWSPHCSFPQLIQVSPPMLSLQKSGPCWPDAYCSSPPDSAWFYFHSTYHCLTLWRILVNCTLNESRDLVLYNTLSPVPLV